MSGRRVGLGAVLMVTMAVSTFAPVAFGVLATTLRTDFGVSRWQIGALVTAVMGVGALLSPMAGSWADRLLPRHSTAITLALSMLMLLGLGLAPSYGWMVAVALFGGIAQAMSNPATNRLIMSQVEAGRRGTLTGIKQAGVQGGNFLGGLLLPLGVVSSLGRAGTLAIGGLVAAAGLGVLGLLVRGRPSRHVDSPPRVRARSTPVLIRLATYAAIAGLANGALMTHLPSFAQEAFGWSIESAGALVSVFAGVGLVTRLTAGSLSERLFGHHRTLATMAALTGIAGILLATSPAGSWLWPTAVLIGMGPMAWNVIANLAVMELSPLGAAGRGSGVMMAGFLAGVAAGAPILGWSADLTGSYRYGWWGVAGLGLTAAWIGWTVKAEPSAEKTPG